MDLVLVNDFAGFNGGASKVALGSARALAERGHRVTVLAGVGPVDPSLQGVRNLHVECLGQHDLLGHPNRAAAALQGIWNANAGRAMRDILAGLDPGSTIVHVHLWAKSLSSSVVRAASDLGFPILLTMHDYQTACPIGTLLQHRTQTVCALKPMSRGCIRSNCDARSYRHKLWRVGRQLAQAGPGRLPGGIGDFIAISELSEQIMTRHLPRGARVHRIDNPVEVAQGPPVQVGTNSSFVFLGRLAAEKGPVLFARAAASAGVKALFIGEGAMRDAVQQANPKAVITGWKTAAEIEQLLAGARALVFPSHWPETQGLVVAEALSRGIPAVVADTSAAREWVADGENGLWFRAGDVHDFTAKLSNLEKNPEVTSHMGSNAYQRYWKNPATLQQHVVRLERLYMSVAERAVLREHTHLQSGAAF